MEEIQLSNEQNQELLSMTRKFSQADLDAFNEAYAELDKKGFVLSGENLMIMVRAYDKSPQAPISVQGILEYTKKFHDAFQWLSAEETEYNKLSAELGPETTQLVIAQLRRHGLVNTAGSEDMFHNFNLVVGAFQSRGWPITADSFERVVTSFHAQGGGRFSKPQGTLRYALTPDQVARQKRWDKAKEADRPLTTKELFEAAKRKAASVAHIVNPDGSRMSDQIMRKFHEDYPEFSETTETPATPQQDITDAAEAHWKQQTSDYIQSLSGQNLLQQEAQRLFGQPLNGSWRQAYNGVQIWHERKKLGVWGKS